MKKGILEVTETWTGSRGKNPAFTTPTTASYLKCDKNIMNVLLAFTMQTINLSVIGIK